MKQGFTLIAAVFIVVIISLMAVVASTFIVSDASIAVRNYQSLQAFYLAEAGFQYRLQALKNPAAWSNLPTSEVKSFGPGLIAITTSNSVEGKHTFIVAGTITQEGKTYSRRILATVALADLDALSQSNAIYSNNDVSIGNNAQISGEASSGEAATLALDTSYYDNFISTAQTNPTFDGNKSFSGSLDAGTYYVRGDVTLDSLSVNGTGEVIIVATGTVSVSNNKNIGDNIKIIAAGLVTIGNAVTIGQDGLWYSSTGLQLGNTGEIGEVVAGGGTAFLTPGVVEVGNTCQLAGLVYSGTSFAGGNNFSFSGLLLSNGDVTIGNDAILTANPNLLDFNGLPGLSIPNPGLTIISWQEL